MEWVEPPAAERPKAKEMVMGFRRDKALPSPVCTGETDVDLVDTYKYLGVVLDNKLEWTATTRRA